MSDMETETPVTHEDRDLSDMDLGIPVRHRGRDTCQTWI